MLKSAQNLEISHSTPGTLLLERLKAETGTMAGAPVSCRLNVRERELIQHNRSKDASYIVPKNRAR
jgi:hypothetical protein